MVNVGSDKFLLLFHIMGSSVTRDEQSEAGLSRMNTREETDRMNRDLQGRVVLITGGGTGLGLGIATELGLSGAKVAIASRKEANLNNGLTHLRSRSIDAFAVVADVREADEVAKAVDSVEARFGPVDILINNAAGNFVVPAERLSPHGWTSVVGTVLNGSFFCSREVGRRLIQQGRHGSIVNIIAAYAWTGGAGTVHSASAKAGVLAMTKTLAVEWAQFGIRVNAVAPGPVETEGASRQLWADPDERERLLAEVPMGRFGQVEEVAQAVHFLVSDGAGFVTGATLTVDGGESLPHARLEVVDKLRKNPS